MGTGERRLNRATCGRKVLAVLVSAALLVGTSGVPVGALQRAYADEAAQGADLAAAAADLHATAEKVDLWKVTVEGGIGGSVGVGDSLVAKALKRSTYGAVGADDDVSYQWQFANTKTTQDAYYTDIDGATSATYVITSDMQGKYLRVKVTSENSVVSTSNPYGGTTLPVDPVGPVQAAAGAVELDSVSLVSSQANSMWVGATITPTAKYLPTGSWVAQPVPQDAAVTYTWKVAESASGPFEAFDSAAYPQSSVTQSGELVIGADLAGKFVRVEANALINTKSSLTWEVLPQGVYDLLRITFGFDTLYAGNTIYTTLQGKTLEYENEASFGTTIPVDDPYTSYQWYATLDEPDADANWTVIEGATDADLVIPESAIGSYVKVVATSSKDGIGTTVEKASTSRVLASGTLQEALEKLEFFHPVPKWGSATNMNDIVADKLATLGYEDVSVKTTGFTRTVENESAHLDVSVADDATNGDVAFFTYDNAASSQTHNFSSYHQVHLTFELSRAGEDPVDFEVTTNIPWDLDAAKAIMDDQLSGFAVAYAEGDAAEAVTQDVTLPCKAGILWVTWQTSNEDVVKIFRDESSGDSLWDPYTGIVTRGADDEAVTLTASVDSALIDGADDTLDALDRTVEFPITVKGDPEFIAGMNTALAQVIDSAFTYESLSDFATKASVDPAAIDADLQLPTPRTLFSGSELSSGDYRVVYSTDNEDVVKANGNRTVTTQPLPGEGDATVALSVTVTHRTIPAVSYTKSLTLTVPALDEAAIDADIAYMDQVRESLFAGLSEGKQEQNAVTTDLHPFQRVYFTDDGQIRWKYDYNDTSDAQCAIGFSPDTVADVTYSDASYARFASSHPGLVADDTLRVSRATRDIGVSITCCLNSDRFGALYERYKADPNCPDALKEKFKQLYRQKISVNVTVKGTQVANSVLEELRAEADEAEALKGSAVASVDGSDVLESAKWVDADTMKALEDAIVVARAVAAKDTATDVEIAAAQSALAKAVAAFEAALAPGTCAYATDTQKSELASAADDAEALMANVYTSDDGKDVDAKAKWAPTAIADRLVGAVAAARAVAKASDIAASEISSAAAELALARAAFERAVKPGLKEAPAAEEPADAESPSGDAADKAQENGAQPGKAYVAGAGKARAKYLVQTAATASQPGTVWYKASKLDKKTAAKALVPAKVKIKGGVYRVVGVSSGAFKNMPKLRKVAIGKNVQMIGASAFKKTKNLKTLVIKGTKLADKTSVQGALFGSNSGKLAVKVHADYEKLAKKVFTKKNLATSKKVVVKQGFPADSATQQDARG